MGARRNFVTTHFAFCKISQRRFEKFSGNFGRNDY